MRLYVTVHLDTCVISLKSRLFIRKLCYTNFKLETHVTFVATVFHIIDFFRFRKTFAIIIRFN
jgi:hypothetical protein